MVIEPKAGSLQPMTSQREPSPLSDLRVTAARRERRRASLRDECLSITFDSIRWEKAFVAFLTKAHHAHKRNGLIFSACLALTFIVRSSFPTWQAKVVLVYALFSISGNILWVVLDKVRPDIANQWRRTAETALAFSIHAAIMMLPPLSYGSLSFPASPTLAILLILPTSRFLQCLFTMGVWTSAGFFCDLGLLTAILYLTSQWNKAECELLCGMQPMLRQHYMNFRQVLSQRLSPAHLPNDAVGMCLLVRYVLQVTFGLVLPVTLGYWRELKDRQQFALLYNVHLKKNTWKGFLMHCLEAYGTCLIVMGFLAQIIVGIPEVADLPMVITGGLPKGYGGFQAGTTDLKQC